MIILRYLHGSFFWYFIWVHELIIKFQKLDLFTWINMAHQNVENHMKIYSAAYLRSGILIPSLYVTSPLPLNLWLDQCNRVFLATLNSQVVTPQLHFAKQNPSRDITRWCAIGGTPLTASCFFILIIDCWWQWPSLLCHNSMPVSFVGKVVYSSNGKN